MNWSEIKKQIAANFCRTVLVIDDEVLVHSDGTPGSLDHAEQFLKAKEEFAKKGILCDLRHIEKSANASSDAMRSSLRHADVIIVDWFLGTEAGAIEDPRESIAVLEEVLKIGGERFVAIHSQQTPDKIREFLDEKFHLISSAREFQGENEDADVIPVREGEALTATKEGEIERNSPDIFILTSKSVTKKQCRIHLCILHKRTASQTAKELPNAVLAALEKAFPDHLHWVGLEFASRVRDMLPELIRGLPSELDVALVFQALVQHPNELANDLVECLCLELKEMLRLDPLLSASDEVVIGRFIEGIVSDRHAAVKGLPGNWVSDLLTDKTSSASKEWAKTQKILTNKGNRGNFTRLLEASLGVSEGVSERAHQRYAALREHFHTVCSEKLGLYPGVVLSRDRTGETGDAIKEWLLCLTPACDCVGDNEHDHLFVRGVSGQLPQGRGVITSIFSCDNLLEIKWMVGTFHTQRCNSKSLEGWTQVTLLRNPFVQKIVQCLWGQQSRVGVNTSEVQRVIRKDDE